jgi:transmembrane 9 superfamily protein 3
MMWTAGLFPGTCFLLALVLNVVGALYHSLAMVPVTSVIAILLIWALVALPLCVVGTILGRNWAGQYR